MTKDTHDKIKLGDTTKTYAGMRDVYMSDFLKAQFKKNLSFDFLFKHPNGNFVTPATINAHFKRLCKDARYKQAYDVLNKTFNQTKEFDTL